jgi:phage baseplate assembly protein W
MANLTKIYSDIDFTFTKKPGTNDVAVSYDAQAVTRSIRNLLLTKNYERLWNPSLGSKIEGLLFELISPVSADLIESEIRLMIKTFEPRADLNELRVTPLPDKNAYTVFMSYFLENATIPTTLTLLLERNR